ncbi:MAG: hypothetical protein M1814_000589 [Vezdaea aestivalis]|nr:MAG: hypothetical protein M1814_000589 [Vezdaea aestivalis]
MPEYAFKIKELHKRYGPIIRISPGELHIDDCDFYDELYTGPSVRKSDRYAWTAKAFAPLALFASSPIRALVYVVQYKLSFTKGTVEDDLHRIRRAAVSNHFSRLAVTRLEKYVQPYLTEIIVQLKKYKGKQQPLLIGDAFGALTNDIIHDYCLARYLNQLENKGFQASWRKPLRGMA